MRRFGHGEIKSGDSFGFSGNVTAGLSGFNITLYRTHLSKIVFVTTECGVIRGNPFQDMAKLKQIKLGTRVIG